jgi:hypothetical protein
MSREDEIQDEASFEFEDIWPDDKPFPLPDAKYARLARGEAPRALARHARGGARRAWHVRDDGRLALRPANLSNRRH